jgi:Leucine-rich repeat (LRR) protein
MEFYQALGGEQWTRNQNWGTDAPLDDWAGLRLDDGALVALQMYYNNLKGEIPEAIGQLKTLQMFSIVGDENVVGKLPESLGDLPNLRMLEISFNSISGAIPASLGKASKLETLWLCYNQLSGEIPGELGELPLEGLNLVGNNLTGNIPEGLTKMNTINRLFLKENRLSGTISSTVNSWLSGIQEAQINPQQEGYGLTR